MSIHRVRLRYSEAGAQSFNGWLSTWLVNMQPWAERPNDVPSQRERPGPHYRGDLTFAWTEEKSIILDQIEGYLSSYCDWYRIGYHVCDHDEADRGDCVWDMQRDGGAVPDFVDSFQIQ